MILDISNKESTCKAVESSRAEQPHAVKGLLTNSGVALRGWRSKQESLAKGPMYPYSIYLGRGLGFRV